MFADAEHAMDFIEAKKPAALGLDTSLAQVALSLSKRKRDAWASLATQPAPRAERLRHAVADSKPAVWWNLKYKDRWLLDGSVVSGNPILTNFLWNEIGRGTDLHQLSDWIDANGATIRELTTAVFSTEAPRFTDFFSPETMDLTRAKHGEAIFLQHCARCHGTYKKGWNLPNAAELSPAQLLATVHVAYAPKTFVVDVGTDPSRYLGMSSLVQLNDLEISKRNGIVIEPQKGYVPPPLVGIWARWPYFHNNSAPSLCAVLTRASDRPKSYWARPANDPAADFDRACNGYPTGRAPGLSLEYRYDTRRAGMHASGHDEGIFLKNGQELLSAADKMDLIQFLQTL
jgi:hypothetical protein